MCARVYACVCARARMRACTHESALLVVSKFLPLHACLCLCLRVTVCLRVCLCVCLYVCLPVCLFVCLSLSKLPVIWPNPNPLSFPFPRCPWPMISNSPSSPCKPMHHSPPKWRQELPIDMYTAAPPPVLRPYRYSFLYGATLYLHSALPGR